jgi:hypothetical protein
MMVVVRVMVDRSIAERVPKGFRRVPNGFRRVPNGFRRVPNGFRRGSERVPNGFEVDREYGRN